MNTPEQIQQAAKEAKVRYRYIVLTIVTLGLLALVQNNESFKTFGPVLYLLLLTFSVFLLALLFRKILNNKTTDAYVLSDQYDKDFAAMPGNQRVWLTLIQYLVYLFIIALVAGHVMGSDSPELDQAKIRPEWSMRLDKVAYGIAKDKSRYITIQDMRYGGVPWFIIGSLHERESSRNFLRHLHEGSSLQSRTAFVPKGRPLVPNPPYTFEKSAEDALYILKSEQTVDWRSASASLDAIEKYNGTGYRRYHPSVPSPYLWSGTTRYSRGKYVADGRFSAIALDQQVGVAALWLRAIERKLF